MEGFGEYVKSFKDHLAEYKAIYDDSNPQSMPLPGIWQSKLKSFEKLLVLNAIRPDKLTAAISHFIELEMGHKFVTPPSFDIGRSFEDSNCLMPLIFILSPGADPMV